MFAIYVVVRPSVVCRSEIAAECLKMFGVSDLVELVATRKDRFVRKYMSSSSVVCEICVICS